MKAFVPYAILGAIGVAGATVGTASVRARAPVVATAVPTAVPTAQVPTAPSPSGAAVRVHAALDRITLPAAGDDAFARVALEGLRADAAVARLGVSLTLVIDRSGSMSGGSKMEDAKRAAIDALGTLATGDRACVVSFDDGAVNHGCVTIVREANDAGASSTAGLEYEITKLFPRGGTDMRAGLAVGGEAALGIHDGQRVNRLLLLSDGQPNDPNGLDHRVAKLAQQGVHTTTLGLGADYNEDLMAHLADAGLGNYHFVETPTQLAGILQKELSSLAAVVAREATIRLAPAEGVEVLEVVGFLSQRDGGALVVPVGDVYGGRITDVLVRLRVPAGTTARDVLGVTVAYTDARSPGAGRTEEQRTLAASFSREASVVAASAVPDVFAKAEKWRAAQAYVQADAAYNRGDKASGDAIIASSAERLFAQSAALKNDELRVEAEEQRRFQAQNEHNGTAWRGLGTKAAKRKAWSMNRGSGY